MTFSQFIDSITKDQVEIWWNNQVTEIIPDEAEKAQWKYKLEKNGKKIPFNYAIRDLAKFYKLELDDFSSNDDTRFAFCEKFDFDIHEDLVYERSEKIGFINFYNKYIKEVDKFQSFIQYAYGCLNSLKINPYKIRVAIADKNRAVIVIGMREVLSYYEKDGFSRVSLMITSSTYNKIRNVFKEYEVEDFGGNDQMKLSKYAIKSWDELPKDLLDDNKKSILDHYNYILGTKRERWNTEAATTNSLLKKLIFENINIKSFMEKNGSSDIVDGYLDDFAQIANQWFADRPFIEERFEFFKEFKKRENLENADWSYFQKLGENLNTFETNPLARANALGRPNHDIEHYRRQFIELIYGKEQDSKRIDTFIQNISYFSDSSTTELFSQIFPDKYVFYNLPDK